MAETLAGFAAGDAPLDARVRIARELARAVAALHARGRVHGALSPSAVLVIGDAVVLAAPAAPSSPLARAGYDAPEVARGGRPTRRSDAFALGALAQLVITGRGPFDGPGALEVTRRVLFEEPRPARLDAPALTPEEEGLLARFLEKRPRRRARPADLARALRAGEAHVRSSRTPTPIPTPTSAHPERSAAAGGAKSTGHPTPIAPSTSTSTATPTATHAIRAAATRLRHLARAAAARTAAWAAALDRRLPPSPLHRAGIAALPLLAIALTLLPRSDAALARDVEAAISAGDLGGARLRLDEAARAGADLPLVEKLRGDLACARGAPSECVRRYRIALAARPELRDDAALRRNARVLLGRDQGCAARRAAALLLGELRDPEALPALEAARRSSGLFAFLCTGDSIERAITATRTAVAER